MRGIRFIHPVLTVLACLIIGGASIGSVTIAGAVERSPLLPGQPVNEQGRPTSPGGLVVYNNHNVDACYRDIDGRSGSDYYGRGRLYLANDRRATAKGGSRPVVVSAKIYDFEVVSSGRVMLECDSIIDTYASVQLVRRTRSGVRRYGDAAVMRGDDNPFYDGREEGETKRHVTLTLPRPLSASDRRSGRYGVRFTIYGNPRVDSFPGREPGTYGYLAKLPDPVKKALPILWIR